MEEVSSLLKILRDKPTGKRPLGRPRRRREDNIRKEIKEIGINMRNWVLIGLRIGILGETL